MVSFGEPYGGIHRGRGRVCGDSIDQMQSLLDIVHLASIFSILHCGQVGLTNFAFFNTICIRIIIGCWPWVDNIVQQPSGSPHHWSSFGYTSRCFSTLCILRSPLLGSPFRKAYA